MCMEFLVGEGHCSVLLGVTMRYEMIFRIGVFFFCSMSRGSLSSLLSKSEMMTNNSDFTDAEENPKKTE